MKADMHDPMLWESIAVTLGTAVGLIVGAFGMAFHSGRQFGEIKTELHSLHGEVKGMRSDVKNLREDFTKHLDKRA